MSKLIDGRPAFFMVEDAVFNFSLTPYEGWVYMAILKHANRQTGVAFPGVGTLAKLCQMSKSQVLRAIDTLERKGFIDVERDSQPLQGEKRQRKPNIYTVKSLTGSVSQTPGVVSTSNHPSVSQTPGVVSTRDNNQSNTTRVKEPEVAAPTVYQLYEKAFGFSVTPMLAEELNDAESSYGYAWVQDALKEAVNSNVRNWKYVQAILERWQRDGRAKTKPAAKTPAPVFVPPPDKPGMTPEEFAAYQQTPEYQALKEVLS